MLSWHFFFFKEQGHMETSSSLLLRPILTTPCIIFQFGLLFYTLFTLMCVIQASFLERLHVGREGFEIRSLVFSGGFIFSRVPAQIIPHFVIWACGIQPEGKLLFQFPVLKNFRPGPVLCCKTQIWHGRPQQAQTEVFGFHQSSSG